MLKELERKQRVKQLVYSWPSLIVLAIITFFLARGAAGIMAIERENAEKVRALESQNEALALRESELKGEIERLKTDEGIIAAIKEKFSVTREGEYVAIIVDERVKASSSEAEGGLGWVKGLWRGVKNLWSE